MAVLPPYQAAIDAAPPVLFGRRLRPLSLGHSYLCDALGADLDLLKSTRCAGWPLDTIGLASWVCSQPWRVSLHRMRTESPRRLQRELRRMGAKLGRGHRDPGPAIKSAVDSFLGYLDAYLVIPDRFSDAKAGASALRAPWQTLVAAALSQGRPSEYEAAMEMPLGEAVGLYAATCVLQGDRSWFSAIDYELAATAPVTRASSPGSTHG